MANPLQMGSVVPSSPALCRSIASLVERGADEYVVELGAGTGVVSRALLAAGVPPERLAVIEIVPDMADFLRAELPGAHVLCADAFALPQVLPQAWQGRIGTVICGIPLVLLPLQQQRRFVAAVEAVAPGRGFLLYGSHHLTAAVAEAGAERRAGVLDAGTSRRRVSGGIDRRHSDGRMLASLSVARGNLGWGSRSRSIPASGGAGLRRSVAALGRREMPGCRAMRRASRPAR